MRKIKYQLLVPVALLFMLASCKTLRVEKPAESYLPANLQPALSELPLQIEIDVKQLEAALNREMTGLLFQEDKLNNQDLSVKVWKAQNFSFTVKNNVIEYRVPLKIWSRFAWTVEKFGIAVGDRYEANGSIVLNFATTVDIDKNWKLVAKTVSKGYQWIETPKINVMGITVPVKLIADYALKESQQMITGQIDQSLSQMVELKKYAGMAWGEMQKPMLLSEENNLWLRITPKDVLLSPFETKGQKLTLTLSLQALIESYFGAKPEAAKPVVLPAFKMSKQQPGEFNLNVAADATFEKISELARQQLLNKTFTEGKRSITINDLSVFGSEGKAIFVADVTGSLKGRIYFTGNMVYNQEKMALEVQHPEFDIKTRDALVKSANWLLNGLIIKKITPYLTYPVKEELDKLKVEANKSLANYKVYEGVSLNGKLNALTVTGLDLVPGAVRLNANLRGNIGLKVSDLSF
ncbi:MAG: DUF4403 family protein [Paludibacter sp.]|nr:DUF4403 family protein [Paludibacter sp.]